MEWSRLSSAVGDVYQQAASYWIHNINMNLFYDLQSLLANYRLTLGFFFGAQTALHLGGFT